MADAGFEEAIKETLSNIIESIGSISDQKCFAGGRIAHVGKEYTNKKEQSPTIPTAQTHHQVRPSTSQTNENQGGPKSNKNQYCRFCKENGHSFISLCEKCDRKGHISKNCVN